jgi:23S rRNA pseudouridine1911/1915/1917 synthase
MPPSAFDPLVPPGLTEVEPDELDQDVEVRDLLIPTDLHRQRLDRALVTLLPEFSRNHLKHLIEDGCVHCTANVQAITKVAHLVKAAEVYKVRLQPTEMSQAYLPQPMDVNVVFEDAHLRVINKPVGLVVHPAPGNWSGTLLNGLLALDPHVHQVPRAGIVHRLDKDTSGLMVTARTRACMDALVDMIAERSVHREYVALSQRPWRGEPEREVDMAVGRDPRNRLRMAVVDLVRQSGKPAQTSLRCLDSNEEGCLVHATLHTGRTHQIRVHMAAIGMPLLGDGLYGGSASAQMQRQALHAYRLSFIHPFSHAEMRFEAALPSDMQASLAAMGLKPPRLE